MTTRRGFLGFLAVGALCAGLSACGRKGSPEFPEGSPYPKPYPQEDKSKP